MPRIVVAGAALALVCGLTACGSVTYVDNQPEEGAAFELGWHRVDPVTVDLPTDRPLGDARLAARSVPTIVNVWASYCAPCEDELPLLQAAAEAGTVRVVGLSRDVRVSAAVSALERAGVTYPNWMDPDARFALDLDGRIPLMAIPSSALLVGDRVVAVHIGEFHNRREILGGMKYVG